MKEKIIAVLTKYIPNLEPTILNQIVNELTPAPLTGAFFDAITKAEKQVLDIILKNINYSEGTIIISQLINQNQISRAVFTSLIAKIEKYRIMEVTSRGVKGTHLKVLVDLRSSNENI